MPLITLLIFAHSNAAKTLLSNQMREIYISRSALKKNRSRVLFGLASRTKIRKVVVHADCRPVRSWGGRSETGRSSCSVGTCRSGLGFRWWKQLELSSSVVCLWGSLSGSLQTVMQPCGARRLYQRPCQTIAGSLCDTHWETSWGTLGSVS